MENKKLDDWELIKIKADILCYGLLSTENSKKLYLTQNPYEDWKTGNVGLHIVLNGKTHVLATICHTFDKSSPYTLKEEGKKWKLFKDSQEVCEIFNVPMPEWYNHKTTSGTPMSKILLHEGRSFLHLEYIGCDYFKIGKPCKFCGTGKNWQIAKPKDIGEVVKAAYTENSKYQVCLGGGTRLPLKRDTEYFLECLKEIRSVASDIPVFIEMVPPENNKDISDLVEAGATSFGFNIEIWDDELRNNICPGKIEISKDRYLEAMEYAIELLGPNRVGSCLLVGLEPHENSIEGAKELASRRIQPCMLIFKPWDKSVFAKKDRCNPKTAIEVGKSVAKLMLRHNIDPSKNHGCLNCEACTIEHDILELYKRGDGGE